MRTLAQWYLESGAPDPSDLAVGGQTAATALACHDAILRCLRPPSRDDVVRETAIVNRLQQSAERFSFVQCPYAVMSELYRTRALDPKTVMLSTRLPAPCVWLEWPSIQHEKEGCSEDRFGALITPGALISNPEETRTIVVCVGGVTNGRASRVTPFGMLSLPPDVEPLRRDGEIRCHWFLRSKGDTAEETNERVKCYLYDVVDALFLINTPRVSEIRQHVPSAKLQRARRRRGKLPLIEYRQVNVVVGVGPTVYRQSRSAHESRFSDTELDREITRRRLHRVVGHFRRYLKDDGTPDRVTYVPQHWRGDAELGIILHDRRVAPPPKKTEVVMPNSGGDQS